MGLYFLMIFTLIFGIGFIYMMYKERRTIWISVLFLGFFGLLSLFFIILGYDQYRVFLIVGIIPLIILIGLPFYIFSFIIALFSSGRKLIKREGLSLSHLLSLALGIFLVVWIFIFPFILKKVNSLDNLFLNALIQFISSCVGYGFILLMLYHIASILNLLPHFNKKYDYIVVLGSGLINNKVPPLLANRIDAGIKAFNKYNTEDNPVKMIFSGGQGSDELRSEGSAMEEFAEKDRNIPAKYLMKEEKSTTTEENLIYSKRIIDEDMKKRGLNREPNVLIATNNYHVLRALLYSKRLGIKADGVGGKTPFYFWLNALIREYIAIIYMNKNKHIKVVILLFILSFGNLLLEIFINIH